MCNELTNIAAVNICMLVSYPSDISTRWQWHLDRRRQWSASASVRGGLMNCIVEDRNRARRVIQQLGERSDVIGTDLVSSTIDPSRSWTVEFALDGDGSRPDIVSLLGGARITVQDVGPQQSWWHRVAVV